MFDALVLTAALALPNDDPTTTAPPQHHAAAAPHRVESPSRGGVGRYGDSNVAAVWNGVSTRARTFWMCVRNHESRHSGHYVAHNGHSSAAGAGQWLTGTWQGVARWVKVHGKYVARGYSTADRAPAWVQDAAFVHVWNHGGQSMWRGTHCGFNT
jgi:hypothetical protein